jgi:putative N6-adenine-specific DNA methylase
MNDEAPPITNTNPATDSSVEVFLVIPVGFERLAQHELEVKFPGLAPSRVEKGGVSFSCPQELIYILNKGLKIPSRILVRLAQFKVKDFPKLFQKTSNLRWGKWLPGADYVISASSHNSRVKLKKRIEETIADGIKRHFQKQPQKKSKSTKKIEPIEILARVFDDECTISLNTSGEGLYKRGYKELSGVAPIRENLAAGLFYALHMSLGPFDEVLDPMLGSGTLLSESFLFFHPSPREDFACLDIPAWADTPWVKDFVSGDATVFPSTANSLKFKNQKSPRLALRGFDKDAQSVQLALNNILSGIQSTLEKNTWDRSKIQIQVLDFLNDPNDTKNNDNKIRRNGQLLDQRSGFVANQRVAIVNPPYGERIRLPLAAKEFHLRLAEWFSQNQVSGFGIIVPTKSLDQVPKTLGPYKIIYTLDFENGGIPVQFQIRKRG